jgi:DNA-binding response OmpR family regulator
MSPKRIIVIEDQEDLAELYKATLTKAGYHVTNAYTGEEGVAEFQADGADAVLLDMTLPEMHGLRALEEIRNISPQVPVIVVTGETSEETRKQCERLGVHDYLPKPVAYEQLKATIRRSLEDTKTTSEEYEVVTLRLPTRVVKCLSGFDENLERAVTLICDEKFKS